MKTIVTLFLATLACLNLKAQTNLAGAYTVTGYFFHPTSPRAVGLLKNITQISTNTYQADIGDLVGSFSFQFTVDANKLDDTSKVRLVLLKLDSNSHSKYMRFILPKKAVENNFAELPF